MSEGGRRVFLVEDEVTIAMMIEDMLEDLGFKIVGSSHRLDNGIRLAETIEADLAILDVNLNGKESFPIADILKQRGIPFFFATGYGAKGLNESHRGTYTLNKPFLESELETAVRRLAG